MDEYFVTLSSNRKKSSKNTLSLFENTAVISIKHVSTIVNKVENHCSYIWIFDLIDKCRYVFYAYDGRIVNPIN